jgi:hypothetical protein
MSIQQPSVRTEFSFIRGLGMCAIVPDLWHRKRVEFFFNGQYWGEKQDVWAIYNKRIGVTLVKVSSNRPEVVVIKLKDYF